MIVALSWRTGTKIVLITLRDTALNWLTVAKTDPAAPPASPPIAPGFSPRLAQTEPKHWWGTNLVNRSCTQSQKLIIIYFLRRRSYHIHAGKLLCKVGFIDVGEFVLGEVSHFGGIDNVNTGATVFNWYIGDSSGAFSNACDNQYVKTGNILQHLFCIPFWSRSRRCFTLTANSDSGTVSLQNSSSLCKAGNLGGSTKSSAYVSSQTWRDNKRVLKKY